MRSLCSINPLVLLTFLFLAFVSQGCVDLPDPAAEESNSGGSTTTGKGFPAVSVRCVVKAWGTAPEEGLKASPTPLTSVRVHAVEAPELAGLIPSNSLASAVTGADGVATLDTIDPGKICSIVIDRDGDGIAEHRTFPTMIAEPVDLELLVYPNSCGPQRWASAEPERKAINHGDLLRVNLYGYAQGSTHLSAALINGKTGAVLWESTPIQVGGNFEKETFVEILSAWPSTAAPSAPSYVLAARLSDDPASGWDTMGGSPVVITGTLVGAREVSAPPQVAPVNGSSLVAPPSPGGPYRTPVSRVSVEITSPEAWFISGSNAQSFSDPISIRTDSLPHISPSSWRLDWDLNPGIGLRSLHLRAGDRNGNFSEPAEMVFLVGATGELAPVFTFGVPRYRFNESTIDFAWTLDSPGGRCLLSLYAALPDGSDNIPPVEWPSALMLTDLAGESIEIGSGEGHLTLETSLPTGNYRLMASLVDPETTVSSRFAGPAFSIFAPPAPGNPPTIPRAKTPENGTDEAPGTGLLSWESTDPDKAALLFDLYFYQESPDETAVSQGSAGSPTIPVASNLGTTSFAYGPLRSGTTWLWKVIAIDPEGKKSASPLFSFKIAQPLAVSILSPDPGETVSGEFTVRWVTSGGPATEVTPDVETQPDALGRTATIEFSRAGGQWITLSSGMKDSGSYLLNSRGLANGEGYQIRVRVSCPPTVSEGAPETAFAVTGGTFSVAN